MIRSISLFILSVASLSLTGCLLSTLSLIPPLESAPTANAITEVVSFSFESGYRGSAVESDLLNRLEKILETRGRPPHIPLQDSELHNHLHIVANTLFQRDAGIEYFAFMTLFLVPLSNIHEPTESFRFTLFVDGLPLRSAEFNISMYEKIWFIYALPGSSKTEEEQRLALFDESVRSFLNGISGQGARMRGPF